MANRRYCDDCGTLIGESAHIQVRPGPATLYEPFTELCSWTCVANHATEKANAEAK